MLRVITIYTGPEACIDSVSVGVSESDDKRVFGVNTEITGINITKIRRRTINIVGQHPRLMLLGFLIFQHTTNAQYLHHS